ncbi:DUF3592 domain-containing protein [Streptomyces sp. 8N114]|uniref:DUF3592 domain-containing protein n=1 Tax=Streptomyces sp. 8N114 TaxID=3457419 RepID=UPI003FD2F4DC
MLVGTVCSAIGCRDLLRARSLRRKGARAEGVVTRLQPSSMRTYRSGPSATVYSPVIAWTTADGRPMETEHNLARELHHNPPPGTQVTVCYDPADPSRWTLPSAGTFVDWFVGAMGAAFAVVGLAMLLSMTLWGSSWEKCDSGTSDYSTSCP